MFYILPIGHYIYLEATDFDPGTRAELETRTFNNARCLSFYFHMYGEHTGSLTVRERNSDGLDNEIFRREGLNGKLMLGNIPALICIPFVCYCKNRCNLQLKLYICFCETTGIANKY